MFKSRSSMLNSTVEEPGYEKQLIQNASSFFSPPIPIQNASNSIPTPQNNPSLTPKDPSLFSPTQLSNPVVLSSSNTCLSLGNDEANNTNGVIENANVQMEDRVDSELKNPLKENVEQEIDIENMSMDMETSGCGQEEIKGEEREREEIEENKETSVKQVWFVCKLAYFVKHCSLSFHKG